MQKKPKQPIFDYRVLRAVMGAVAFALPFAVTMIASDRLPSVSAAYYSESRDVFVGMMFIVGAFLLAYNGHTNLQAAASKIAAIAAACIAILPTSKICETSTWVSTTHTVAAVVLLAILAFFCLGPFRAATLGRGVKQNRRALIYIGCGLVMIGAILFGAYGMLAMDCQARADSRIIYWVEAIALAAFGVAWFVAGKMVPFLADDDEALKLFEG